MRILTYSALVIGLGLAVLLVAWHGAGTIAAAMATLGASVLLLPLIYAPHLVGAAASWSLLFPAGCRPAFPIVLRAVWIGTSVEAMLPAASLGAELVKARLLIRAGCRGSDACSSVVVDVTVQGLVLAVWAMIGLAALVLTHADATLTWPAAAGAAVMAAGIIGFLIAQRAGFLGFLAKAGARMLRQARWRGIVDGATTLDVTFRAIYARPFRILLAVAIRCLSRSMLLVELWLIARLMGYPIAVTDAAMLLGLIGAIRAATIVVPGGWGVQEGGFVLLGGLIGLPPEMMLALSLVTRAREVMVGVPALAVWQFLEGRTLRTLRKRRPG